MKEPEAVKQNCIETRFDLSEKHTTHSAPAEALDEVTFHNKQITPNMPVDTGATPLYNRYKQRDKSRSYRKLKRRLDAITLVLNS